ncbi:hypothetical protein CEQ90_11445 [Lewinellaceae bacterium SD302]|nr:hypothetical protein CEQ90_11445 [Lewinellaceae bacterium SD302]
MRNLTIILFWAIVTMTISTCSKEDPKEIPECGVFGDVLEKYSTGELIVDYNGSTREGVAGILYASDFEEYGTVTSIGRYCSSFYTDPVISIRYIPVTTIGDTLSVKPRCTLDRCPTDFPTGRILSYNGDIFVSSYIIDPDQESWLVVNSWNSATKSLRYSFELYFVRESVAAGFDEDIAPLTVSLTNGYLNAYALDE